MSMNKFDTNLAVEFENLVVEICCNNAEAYRLADLLFCDLAPVSSGLVAEKQRKKYEIISAADCSDWSFLEGKRRIYHGQSLYTLAYEVVNEVLYHCIAGNKNQHALHAGAVSCSDFGIIIPGMSGRGKSTFTALLCQNGYSYLTDELLFLTDDGRIIPFTRPINLKTRKPVVTDVFLDKYQEQIILSDTGESIIPHRLLNKSFSANQPFATHIIFPEYREGAKTALIEISPAKSCFRLLQCHVNARNLPSHGIFSLSDIARNCRSYDLIYSDFDTVKGLLQTILPQN